MGLTIKHEKCEFGRKFMMYLGHQLGCGRLAVPKARVTAMANYGRQVMKRQTEIFSWLHRVLPWICQ